MQNAAFKFVGVHQAAWHTRCDDEVSLHFNAFFLPVQLNPFDAVLHIQNIAQKENINVEKMLFKTETKPFTQNAYVWHFLEGHLLSLHSRLKQESPKTCQIHVSST